MRTRYPIIAVLFILSYIAAFGIPVSDVDDSASGNAPAELPQQSFITFTFTEAGSLKKLPGPVAIAFMGNGVPGSDLSTQRMIGYRYEKTGLNTVILRTKYDSGNMRSRVAADDTSWDLDELSFDTRTSGSFVNKANGSKGRFRIGNLVDGNYFDAAVGGSSTGVGPAGAPKSLIAGSTIVLTSNDGWTIRTFEIGKGTKAKLKSVRMRGGLSEELATKPTIYKFDVNPSKPQTASIQFRIQVANNKLSKIERDWGATEVDSNYLDLQFDLTFSTVNAGTYKGTGEMGRFEIQSPQESKTVAEQVSDQPESVKNTEPGNPGFFGKLRNKILPPNKPESSPSIEEQNAGVLKPQSEDDISGEKLVVDESTPGPIDMSTVQIRDGKYWIDQRYNIFEASRLMQLWTYIAANGSVAIRGAGTNGRECSPGGKIAYFSPDEIGSMRNAFTKVMQWSKQCRSQRMSGVEKPIVSLRYSNLGFFFDGNVGFLTVKETLSRPWSPEGAGSEQADGIRFTEYEIEQAISSLARYNTVMSRFRKVASQADNLK